MLSAVIGGIALPLLEIARDAVFRPELLRDGQYVLLPAAIVPQGLWIGFGIGSAILLCRLKQLRRALATLCFYEAALLAACLAFVWHYPLVEILESLALGYFSVSLCCGLVGLVIVAAISRKRLAAR